MGFKDKTRESGASGECAISVGEHVWVSGRAGEYVVMGVEREKAGLQVLRVGTKSVLESVPLTSVRAVLAPKAA
ncbi:MAG: hypothetical protein WCF17_08215 [Terracidiphilus sp.]